MKQFKKFKDIMTLMTYLEQIGFNIAELNKTINTYNDALFFVRDLVGRSFYYDELNGKFVLEKQPDSRKSKLLRYATGVLLVAHGEVVAVKTSKYYIIQMKDVSYTFEAAEDVFKWAQKEIGCVKYVTRCTEAGYNVSFYLPL